MGAVTARATLGVPQGSAQVPFGGNLGEKGPGRPSPLWASGLGENTWLPRCRGVLQPDRLSRMSGCQSGFSVLGPSWGDPSPVPRRLTAVGGTEEFSVP